MKQIPKKNLMVGSRIKYFRELRNYKREWLAEQLGIDASQVNRIENNQSEVTIQRLYKIAQLFKISIIDLIEEKYLTIETELDNSKYGPVEASYIRFLLHQNELQRLEYTNLLATCDQMMENMGLQQTQFKKLMDHISETKEQKDLTPLAGGGGVKNSKQNHSSLLSNVKFMSIY